MDRRGFLKVLGAAVAAPLFIPSDRLDFGVPRGLIALPTDEEVVQIVAGYPLDTVLAAAYIPEIWSQHVVRTAEQRTVFASLVEQSLSGANYGNVIRIPGRWGVELRA